MDRQIERYGNMKNIFFYIWVIRMSVIPGFKVNGLGIPKVSS